MDNINYNYRVVSKTVEFEGQDVLTYGIKAMDQDGNEIMTIEDITVNKFWIERLASQFNAFQLSPVHLASAVEDFLVELPRDLY